MSFIPPGLPPLDREIGKAKQQEIDWKANEYSRTHPDGPVPSPRPHPIVHRLWRVLQGRHHGHD